MPALKPSRLAQRLALVATAYALVLFVDAAPKGKGGHRSNSVSGFASRFLKHMCSASDRSGLVGS